MQIVVCMHKRICADGFARACTCWEPMMPAGTIVLPENCTKQTCAHGWSEHANKGRFETHGIALAISYNSSRPKLLAVKVPLTTADTVFAQTSYVPPGAQRPDTARNSVLSDNVAFNRGQNA